ncbi:MAG: hypothetical protein JRJ40_01735 [Deltaproteobacteria bacterium]|nr:hypothetical protein [Deltaproteobacteria bacterium]
MSQKSISQKSRWTKHDILHVIVMVLATLFFSGKAGSLAEIFRQVLVSFLYGFGIVYLFIGLTKKMFKYNPTRLQIIKWATSLAALVAVCQFVQQVYQTYLEVLKGQVPQ